MRACVRVCIHCMYHVCYVRVYVCMVGQPLPGGNSLTTEYYPSYLFALRT